MSELALRYKKIQQEVTIKEDCGRWITNGFTSSALGAEHRYSSELENQLNMLESISSGVTVQYKCTDVATNTKQARAHTLEQMKTVYSDFIAYKEAQLTIYENLVANIDSALTIEAVETVIWPDPNTDEVRNAEALAEAKRLEPENYK